MKGPDCFIFSPDEKYCEHIKEVKSQVLPFLEDVTEQRFYVEKVWNELGAEEWGCSWPLARSLTT